MYDVIIIGCGMAGMTSAIYAARANKKVLVLEKESIGGQIASSPLVENYPGYISISGSELANNIFEQVLNLGVEIELEEVKEIKNGKVKKIITENNMYETKTIIIATGGKHRTLGIKDEQKYFGNGINFCVACDGAFYKNKVVAVVGGGNSAVVNAITLATICNKVYIIQDMDHLTAEATLVNRIKDYENIEVIYNSAITDLHGDNELNGITIKTKDKEKELKIDGLFVSIGLIPQSELAENLLSINEFNYIESDNCTTEIPGIFVAGDCRDKNIRQLTVAASDGTVAALAAINYLNKDYSQK